MNKNDQSQSTRTPHVGSSAVLSGDPWTTIQQADFYLRFRLPGDMEIKEVKLTVDARAVDCIRPLPRNREIEWEHTARIEAARMKEERGKLAAYIGKCYAYEIEKALAGKDSINGYTPEEWTAINRKPDNADSSQPASTI